MNPAKRSSQTTEPASSDTALADIEATASTVQDRVSIPLAEYAPKPESKPAYRPEIKNFADKPETVARVLAWARSYLSTFKSQGQRDKFEDDMDAADEMARGAKQRTQVKSDEANVTTPTRSDLSNASYFIDLRTITAGQMSVIMGNEEELPVVYEPSTEASEYTAAEGRRIAADRNLYLARTMDDDGMREKVREILLFANQYGNQLVEMAWEYRKAWVTERIPVFAEPKAGEDQDKPRVPTGWKWERRERVVKDNATLIRHDMKDVWFDCMIPNVQQWSCVVIRHQDQTGDVWGRQRTGEFKEVGKITTQQLYGGEGDSTPKSDRQDNAGENADAASPTSLLDGYTVWIRVPVDAATGEWAPDREMPTWHKCVFIGDLNSNPVCTQLSPNPTLTDDIPFELIHPLIDDKGAIAKGYATLTKSLNQMENVAFNQIFDCNRERIYRPLVADRGSLFIREKTWADRRRLWWKKPGSMDPHELQVEDMTQNIMPILALIKQTRKDVMGVNKTMEGTELGSRTSSREAGMVYEQGIKPALEDAKFLAGQLLPFIAQWVAEYASKFGDPERRIQITGQVEQREITPKNIWGPFKVRVISVRRFYDSIVKRQEQNQFLNQFFPLFEKYMGPELVVRMGKQILKDRHFQDVEEGWQLASDADARRLATIENDNILFAGVNDLPQEGENHKAHLAVHEPFYASYLALPPDQQNQRNAQIMGLHIQIHHQLIDTAARQATGASVPKQLGAGSPPENDGEAAQDMLAGPEGAMQNMGAAEPLEDELDDE